MQKGIIQFFVFVILSGIAMAQVPQLINYQGVLIDPDTGDPVPDDTYEMVFSIYDVPSGGSAIWSETKNIQTENGLYSVMLGSTTALTSTILSGPEKYLGIKVGSDPEMTPRKRIFSVAYAITSSEISGASNIFPSDGYVGIGTKSPRGILELYNDSNCSYIYTKGIGDDYNYAGLILESSNNKSWSLVHKKDQPNCFNIIEFDGSNWHSSFTIKPGGDVGIGLWQPAYKLDVAGDINFSGSLYQNGTLFSGGSLWSQNGNNIFYNNGKVGIGTTEPLNYLTVVAPGSSDGGIAVVDSTNAVRGLMSMAGERGFIELYDSDPNSHVRLAPGWIYFKGTKVGIGTDNPNADLHVDGIDGVLFTGIHQNGTIPVEGAGTRMMWYPGKAAFRLGTLSNDHSTFWDDDSIGDCSIAMGEDSKATRSGCIAIGIGVVASGKVSTAFGVTTWAKGDFSTAMGGMTTAKGHFSTAMGQFSRANGNNSTAMGAGTIASGESSTAMGESTTASGDYSTAMGSSTTASGDYSTVAGGRSNSATDFYATISGGRSNVASGWYSAIGGGNDNQALGYGAMVPGGWGNIAAAERSFAAGRRAKANHHGAFVWADDNDLDFASTAVNQFNIRATGGTQIFSNLSLTAGVRLNSGASSWSSVSDSTLKRNIRPVDEKEILSKLANLMISRWSYKAQDPGIEHIGPMAQDFYAAFGIGEDDKHITTVDADGVALAAIQGLYQVVKEKDAQIEMLKERLAKLEALMNSMAK